MTYGKTINAIRKLREVTGMAIPSRKSSAIASLLDDITIVQYGRTRTKAIEQDICVACGGDAKVFDTDLSRVEYRISGLCQVCQDKVF